MADIPVDFTDVTEFAGSLEAAALLIDTEARPVLVKWGEKVADRVEAHAPVRTRRTPGTMRQRRPGVVEADPYLVGRSTSRKKRRFLKRAVKDVTPGFTADVARLAGRILRR